MYHVNWIAARTVPPLRLTPKALGRSRWLDPRVPSRSCHNMRERGEKALQQVGKGWKCWKGWLVDWEDSRVGQTGVCFLLLGALVIEHGGGVG